MANERSYPCLPCPDIDEAIAFYQALGFTRTYRQLRPNPYAVVAREDLHIHLFVLPDFDPAASYGNVIIVVPDPDTLYHSFAQGLRAAYRKLPAVGIPRILRPRKKFGTIRGFSVVDVGGNWLRFSKLDDSATLQAGDELTGLAGFVSVAARIGDDRGDEAVALKTIENGLKKFPDASALDRARAFLYRAELAIRLQNKDLAQASLSAAKQLELTRHERESLAEELAETTRLVEENSEAG